MTSNPTLHIHPNPPISEKDLNDVDGLTVIAAGIGHPVVINMAKRIKPSPGAPAFCIAILESATGIEWNDEGKKRQQIDGYEGTYENITEIIRDLPRSVWNRVCDLLHDGRPDAALRVIQAHHNVVKSLSNEPIPEWTNSTPPEAISQHLCWNFEAHDTPRDGYTYIKRGGLYYGPIPINEFHPPMVHAKDNDAEWKPGSMAEWSPTFS